MIYSRKISELADKFERKLAQQIQSSQWDTSSLFFKKDGQSDQQAEANQRNFAALAQKENGPVYKILSDYWQKNSTQPVSFTATIAANPGKGAMFNVIAHPAALKSQIVLALDQIFQSIMGQSISSRQTFADSKAKNDSAGSGNLPLAELILE